MHIFRAALRGNDDAAFGMVMGNVQKALAQPFVKGGSHALVTVFIPATAAGAKQSLLDRQIENNRQIRREGADGKSVKLFDQMGGKTMPIALISQGAVGETV